MARATAQPRAATAATKRRSKPEQVSTAIRSPLRHFDAEAVSSRVRREVRNREVHLPPVSTYRWWARRTEAVNGSIIDAVSADRPGRMVVSDPFAGGGVIPLAAVMRGHSVYAQDLKPVGGAGTRVDACSARPRGFERRHRGADATSAGECASGVRHRPDGRDPGARKPHLPGGRRTLHSLRSAAAHLSARARQSHESRREESPRGISGVPSGGQRWHSAPCGLHATPGGEAHGPTCGPWTWPRRGIATKVAATTNKNLRGVAVRE